MRWATGQIISKALRYCTATWWPCVTGRASIGSAMCLRLWIMAISLEAVRGSSHWTFWRVQRWGEKCGLCLFSYLRFHHLSRGENSLPSHSRSQPCLSPFSMTQRLPWVFRLLPLGTQGLTVPESPAPLQAARPVPPSH